MATDVPDARLEALERAIAVLLDDDATTDPAAWTAAVERAFIELTDADRCVLHLPAPRDDPRSAGAEVRSGAAVDDALLLHMAGLDPATDTLHAPVTARVRAATGEAAWLTVFSLRRRDDEHAGRAAELIDALLPAITTAVETHWRAVTARAALTRTLDALNQPALACDGHGRVVEENRAMADLVANDDRGAALRGAAEGLARRLARADPFDRDGVDAAEPAREATLGEYHLRGRVIEHADGERSCLVLVVREAEEPAPVVVPWRERFGLTAREADVAELLAAGRSNEQIADRLGISRHTVEKHVGRILAKLDVTSRAAVPARLRQR